MCVCVFPPHTHLFGLHFKTFFFCPNPVTSLDLLASEKRSEFVTSAESSELGQFVPTVVSSSFGI